MAALNEVEKVIEKEIAIEKKIEKGIDSEIKKEVEKLKLHESVPFGILLSVVGGFLDAYTYISRDGVFANAQTGNMVLLGIHASHGEWQKTLTYLLPILAFVLGVILTETMKKASPNQFQLDWPREVLLVETIILVILGFIPLRFPNIVVTVTISFVASVQVCSFSKLVDSSYATTMMTGNLRQLSQAAYKAIVYQDRDAKAKAVRYITIISSFILGAVAGGILTKLTGVRAVWGAAAILLFCFSLLCITEHGTAK